MQPYSLDLSERFDQVFNSNSQRCSAASPRLRILDADARSIHEQGLFFCGSAAQYPVFQAGLVDAHRSYSLDLAISVGQLLLA